MDYSLTNLVQSILHRHGLGAGLAAIATVIGLYVLMRVALAWVEAWRGRQAALVTTEQQKVAGEEARTSAMVAELAAARQQNERIMTNHLEHDKQERQAIVDALHGMEIKSQATVDALRAVAESLRDHREEEAKRSAGVHDRLNSMEKTISKIEGALG